MKLDKTQKKVATLVGFITFLTVMSVLLGWVISITPINPETALTTKTGTLLTMSVVFPLASPIILEIVMGIVEDLKEKN